MIRNPEFPVVVPPDIMPTATVPPITGKGWWKSANWELPDTILARIHLVSRTTIRAMRIRHGVPAPCMIDKLPAPEALREAREILFEIGKWGETTAISLLFKEDQARTRALVDRVNGLKYRMPAPRARRCSNTHSPDDSSE